MNSISIVIPAKNEAPGLSLLLPELIHKYHDAEIIVVNDGSTDETSEVCKQFGVIEIIHKYSRGNGAAIKSGALAASREMLVFMDGDGQHQSKDITTLIEKLREGFDMVVGSRNSKGQSSIKRSIANRLYNVMASWMVGHAISDLTSGFRVVDRNKFMEFLYLLPNGFSYPTTITMAFFRAGYSVAFTPINVKKRLGKSHINILRDGIRFFLIIFKVGTLYSPLKIFFPTSIGIFSIGLVYYLHTYLESGRFTNMSALLFTTALLIFFMGLISEQITALIYKDSKRK